MLIDRHAVSNPDQQPTGESASPEDCPEVSFEEVCRRRSLDFLPSDGQTRNNPSGTKAGFTNGWMGKTDEVRVPPRENLLVEVGEVTLAADSTLRTYASSDTYPGTHHPRCTATLSADSLLYFPAS